MTSADLTVVTVPARLPCARRHVLGSWRGAWEYRHGHTVTTEPFRFVAEFDARALDPAAALLLPHLARPGLRIYGCAQDGSRGILYPPVYRIGADRPLAQWINQWVADCRDGRKWHLPLTALIVTRAWGGRTEIRL